MYFGAEMMLRVIPIEKPQAVVKLVVTAYAPRQRLIRIAAIMPVITVQI
jgi:hypothetical protein